MVNKHLIKDRYCLATTNIVDFWDLETRQIFLGPWCLTGKTAMELIKGRDYKIADSPWKPEFKIKEAADYCRRIYIELLPQLSESLNNAHQESYPLKYWQVLLGPWLLYFIEVFYDRYKRIEKVFELFPDFYTYALPIEEGMLASFDTYDFHAEKVNEDYYNLKLFSLIAHEVCRPNIIVKEYKEKPSMYEYSIKSSWKRKLFNGLLESLDIFFKSPIVLCDMYHLSPYDRALLKLKGGFKTVRFIFFESIRENILENKYSPEIRSKIELKGVSDRFQFLLYKILPEAIPMCYMENYKFYRGSIKGIKNIDSVKITGSAIGWYFNERFKFFAAERASAGASLVDFQHGGGYGISLIVPHEAISLEKDIFYTWGWGSKNANKTKPLPSPHLSKLKDTYSPRLDNILFISNTIPRYHFWFDNGLFPEDMSKYFEDQKIFFDALPEKMRNKILCRLYTYDYGWNESDVLKEICPGAKVISNGRLVEWMKKARLTIIDNSHTSFIEALTINTPSIFYWDHKVRLMRPEVERYFDLLREVGILFKDPLSAAKKAKDVFASPLDWWLKNDIQNARLEFCRQYAYARKDWMKIWVEELSRLIEK
ncbi:MAG: LIC12162 family protein [Candidatus Omnitrophota bacterium]|nr:LIC12162 family protein [Candidatus Omnitrophota bacterium]